jgi:hypothetical protein
VEAALVAGKVERGCQEADKEGGKGLKAACKVFVRELTREENPNRRRNGGAGLRQANPSNDDPMVIGHYLINKRGAVYHGAPDNAGARYKLPDGRMVLVSWEGWTVSAGRGYGERSGSGVHELNDWLVNEPARQSAREIAEREIEAKAKEQFKAGRASQRVMDFIEKIREGMERASGEPVQVTGPDPRAIEPEVKIKGGSTWVTVNLGSGEYFAQGLGPGKAPKKLFDYLAKYGDWEG